MKSRRALLFLLCSYVCIPSSFAQQRSAPVGGGAVQSASALSNIVSLTFGTLLLTGFADLSYERLLSGFISVRVGYEGSVVFETESSHGVFGLINVMSAGSSKFEAGIGAGYLRIEPIGPAVTGGWKVRPAFTVGYRSQAPDSRFCFRLGASYYGSAPGIHCTLGFAFPG